MGYGRPTVGATGDGIFPGWWLVGLVGLILAVATGLAGFHLTTWVLSLEDELGVGVETVAAAVVTFSLLSWVLEPVAGFLADRVVSIRWLVIPGLVIMAGAYLFLSQIQSAWMVFAVASVMAVGAAMCGWVLLMALLCRWFVRRRTLAVALASMAVPLGSLFLIPLIFYASDIGFVGWRNTAIVLGVFVLLIAAAALAWLRNHPEDRGLLPYGASAAMQLPRFRALQALRTRGFWLIAVGDGLAAMGIEKTLGSEEGSGERAIALAVIGIVALPFMLVAGLLGHRVSKSSLLALFAALQVVGLVLFAFIDTPASSYFCAAVLAAGEGGRAPLRVSIMADYFGADSLATILGLFGFFAGFTGFAGSLLVLPMYQVIADGMVPLVPAGLALVAAYCFLKARAPQLPAAEEAEVSGYC